jgi:hypothetical protein
MIKQKEAQKIYEQIRPKVLLEASKSLPKTQIVEQLIEKEREPTKIALLQWLKPELEALIRDDHQLSNQTQNLGSLLPFQRLSPNWFNNFTKSKLLNSNDLNFIESPPLFDAFGKKIGHIGPILFQSSVSSNGDITFRFDVETKKNTLQKTTNLRSSELNNPIPSQGVQENSPPKRGLRI